MTASQEERVVLLDEEGRPCGESARAEVHSIDTPLHLAFSCWIHDTRGQWLLTRRAEAKLTWPLAWTNTVCGHPAPGEDLEAAVRRRARDELALDLEGVYVVLPAFRYRAQMANGIVENEVCPVFTAVLAEAAEVHPNPTEVADWRWTTLSDLRRAVSADPRGSSPWMLAQLSELTGPDFS
ncbi:MAG: isopentenyl-diphosphate Delta-isomerase [Geodermatophilaceae bacterium]|nr:isopentenyl-diphosphate Delta-isomerase [Geodermatophilaceae bacterium]